MAQHSPARAIYDLLSSMRFAVSLLTILAIASVVGTVLKQAEPYANYISQFGPFWFPVFESLGLYDVYHAAWFLAILSFLVLSTSLCIFRNGPAMLREMRNFREQATERSLQHIQHRVEYEFSTPSAAVIERVAQYLNSQNYRFRTVARGESGADTLFAAKAGSYHRVGYLLAHSGIVVICIGGLLDGNIPLKLLQLTGQKVVETRDVPQSKVPPESRLSPSNLSFRGNVNIPEGSSASVIFMNIDDGYFVQDLPFTIALNKFHIDHYSTGQPKDFASDIVVIDRETGERFERTIRVNYPFIYKGVAIYQASFADGGTRMQLKGWPSINRPASKAATQKYGWSFPISGLSISRIWLQTTPRARASKPPAYRKKSWISWVLRLLIIQKRTCAMSDRVFSIGCATHRARRVNSAITCCRCNWKAPGIF
jgi:cytochrome c biogenesis protein